MEWWHGHNQILRASEHNSRYARSTPVSMQCRCNNNSDSHFGVEETAIT